MNNLIIMKVGDKVEVVKYGGSQWISKSSDIEPYNIIDEDDKFYHCDTRPDVIGSIGIIVTVSDEEGKNGGPKYALHILEGSGYYAWYDQKQLKLLLEIDYENGKVIKRI